jgi:competence protein ComEA
MKSFLSSYFQLSNTEQRGIIVLIALILFVGIGSKVFLAYQDAPEIPQDNTLLLAQFSSSEVSESNLAESSTSQEFVLQNFDPNTASLSTLLSLGFKENTAQTLLNFRSKGGKFYKKEDLLKVYGVNEDFYQKVAPYIVLAGNSYESKNQFNEKTEYSTKKWTSKEKVVVELNSADSATLTQVTGIGPVFASRIVKYRKLLGGFAKKEQLLEVYGLDDEKFAQMLPQLTLEIKLTKININKASWQELKAHPYLGSNLANAILAYKKEHGAFKSLETLVEAKILNEATFQKMYPYLSIE